MSEIIKAIREIMAKYNQNAMKIGEIFKALTKDRMNNVSQIERDELVAALNHYSKLQIIHLDADETVIFL